jgi:CBS domain containing-hemolysin-like protein
MRQSRNELACVVDEYGNFDGILTIEDLTEEVAGEFSDEHDDDVQEAVVMDDERWRIPGDVHLDEVERLIGHDLDDEDDEDETIAGLIIREHGDLLPVGAVVRVDLPEKPGEVVQGIRMQRWLDVEVIEVARLVPSQVAVRVNEIDLDATEGEAVRTDSADHDGEVTR